MLQRDEILVRDPDAAELAEARSSLSALEVLNDRMLGLMARQHDEVTRGQRTQSECAMLRTTLEEARQENQRLLFLNEMISVKLMLRAKRYWDRAPRLKQLVKGALKPLT